MLTHHSNLTTMPTLPPLLTVLLVLVFLASYLRLLKYFIDDLYQPERRVFGGDKTIWLLVIIFGSVFGIMAYLFFGRES